MANDKPNALKEALRLAAEAKEEIIALKVICAILLGEIALINRDESNPREKLDKMVAGLQGVGAGLAIRMQGDSQRITDVIESVASMAEAALHGPAPSR